ncbi:MAG TPA: 1-acyl-sn-glycerol-3-phosphate acyltransferase [Oligoflexus sp.]|uniref:lysophospholipid acyltransferase family protein n=1 Tax=Oligoflexus sp. TaxID=1971216 RepID=UPI002D3B0DDC|nr:1-acyl-sn-glycerol-3-phosphate acyltransferase [Oligoflexus sp.]HYX38745.1 1-acyl-sn-glycerol-3-phosphate acyltransferase [Oligoflexus sp.]
MYPATAHERPLLPRVLVFGRAILISFLLIVPLLVINGLQMLSLIVKPFSKPLFRTINRRLAHTYWTLLVWLLDKVYRVRFEWHSEELPLREDAILIANHQTAVDVMPLFALAERCGRIGDMKFFVKEVFKYIPGPGWGMIFLDCIFLKRRWMADRRRIKATFERFRAEKIPLWLNIFPEGTRYTPKKMLEAQNTARHYQLPLCEHVLIPYAKAFETSILGLQDRVQAVYDITIGYPQGIPTLWQLLCGEVRLIEVHVARFSLDQLPREAPAIEAWLNERFWAKEQHLLRLQKEGTFRMPKKSLTTALPICADTGWTAG